MGEQEGSERGGRKEGEGGKERRRDKEDDFGQLSSRARGKSVAVRLGVGR
jgi:hypothetical protein